MYICMGDQWEQYVHMCILTPFKEWFWHQFPSRLKGGSGGVCNWDWCPILDQVLQVSKTPIHTVGHIHTHTKTRCFVQWVYIRVYASDTQPLFINNICRELVSSAYVNLCTQVNARSTLYTNVPCMSHHTYL